MKGNGVWEINEGKKWINSNNCSSLQSTLSEILDQRGGKETLEWNLENFPELNRQAENPERPGWLEFPAKVQKRSDLQRTPKIYRRASRIQLRTDKHMNVRKLPKARKRASQKDKGQQSCVHRVSACSYTL